MEEGYHPKARFRLFHPLPKNGRKEQASAMKMICYRSYEDRHALNGNLVCNRCSNEHPILVNYAGTIVITWSFKTDNPLGRQDYYLMYLKTGTLRLSLGKQEFTVSPGTLVLIPPETPYSYYNRKSETIEYYFVHFTGSYTTDLIEKLSLIPLPLVRPLPDASSAVDYRMLRMFDIFIRNSAYRDCKLANCAEALLIELAEYSSGYTKEKNKLSKSIEYINNHYTSDLTVPELAAMEFLSVSRYTELFRKIMNTTPYQYIIRLRFNVACDMLIDSDLTIEQISNLTGFRNSFFFSKLFKKHMGLSPLQYRKKATEKVRPKSKS